MSSLLEKKQAVLEKVHKSSVFLLLKCLSSATDIQDGGIAKVGIQCYTLSDICLDYRRECKIQAKPSLNMTRLKKQKEPQHLQFTNNPQGGSTPTAQRVPQNKGR